jgi:hypothetical protein
MTEAFRPLNWHGFGEDTLCEGEVWFSDAWQGARAALVKPPAQTDQAHEEQERVIGVILKALSEGQIVVYARHPQSDEKRLVEPHRWLRFSGPLIGGWDKVPDHYSDDFGPFVNRRLRTDGKAFLEWLQWMRTLQGNNRKLGSLPGFELIDYAKQEARERIKASRQGEVSASLPQGYIGIHKPFRQVLDAIYPEQLDQSCWVSPTDDDGWTRGPVPPIEILEAWQPRLLPFLRKIPIPQSNWLRPLLVDVATRLDAARHSTGIRVYYWSNRDARAFDVPDRLLRPGNDFLANGSVWFYGQITNLFGPDELDFLDGAAAFVEEGNERLLLDSCLKNAGLSSIHETPKRGERGPKKGGGWAKADEALFPEITKLIKSGQAKSAFGAASIIGNRLPGTGDPSHRAKRIAKRYIEAQRLSESKKE